MLNLNGRNPVARAKLAELLEKTGEFEDAAEQWRLAAEQFLEKGDHSSCIDIVERLLRTRTDDTELRDLLSQAQVQRDSLRVLDGMLGRDF